MDFGIIGDIGLLVGGLAALIAAVGYVKSVGKRYSYREWRRDVEWKLARLDAASKLKGEFGRHDAKIVVSYREALARLDELELKMRALEGPEPGPPEFPGLGRRE